jgi:formylglycine-generating enzyme required for sulfatase activity
LLILVLAAPASAVIIPTVGVSNAGNAPDTQMMNDGTSGYGSVPYVYYIGTTKVTNAQYVEFLNAKAASDPLGLYNENMDGITQSGIDGSHSYATVPGRENRPVAFVSWYDAIRFDELAAQWVGARRYGDRRLYDPGRQQHAHQRSGDRAQLWRDLASHQRRRVVQGGLLQERRHGTPA